MSQNNTRYLASLVLKRVLDDNRSMTQALAELPEALSPSQKGQIQDFCFGTLRQLARYSYYLNQLTEQKLSAELNPIRYLIAIGMYQLDSERVADHAALAETVDAVIPWQMPKMKGLVNAVLRSYQREQESLAKKADATGLQVTSSHPQWLISKLKKAYPKGFKKIIKANLAHPPFWLRVNTLVNSAEHFSEQLKQADIEFSQDDDAILLEQAIAVDKLPGFAEGSCAVQDKAAQQAAKLLNAQAGERVLDACAAPGGKTAHILAASPDVKEVVALDIDATRLNRVAQNLTRLKADANLIAADASDDKWWDKEQFDRILLDAPCSATGVIRRHPDIMYLRRETDIAELAKLQKQILDNLWPMLKPGGTLLYATCSVLPEENKQQITEFLQQHKDAKLAPIFDSETASDPGWQIFPGNKNMDGFYYARLVKQA
ncbi:16S rRNA (cytosine(967)-C(5))-methyltransferase RsmB [Catenovulum sp. SM1970]|uniref:16S rRNA (cytosine(967)-C(5))-methyltransferase RsmB n=1 Tax=Marinifaba aquimaris TaxID=2741323 RepID=UPI001573B36F|nr:16S rRNA (cytosine(967)-C(5))-methyltransferase RsmB [Marinifaba aquimaris]NTS78656.1 16S rRNA (cytosine(967)-C(5))-methyltransferase RsmB [Marinifaba aquimaris]